MNIARAPLPRHAIGRLPDRWFRLLNAIPAVVWRADLETLGRPFVSWHAEEVFGYRLLQWRKDAFWMKNVHPEDRQRVLMQLRQLLDSSDKDAILKYRFIAKDGRTVWLRDLTRVERTKTGRPVSLVGVMVDVSDRREWGGGRAEGVRRSTRRKIVRLPLGRRLARARRRPVGRRTIRTR